jgi:hypothetical protein
MVSVIEVVSLENRLVGIHGGLEGSLFSFPEKFLGCVKA